MFNIFAQLQKELHSFFNDKVHIAGTEINNSPQLLSNKAKGYDFNQNQTVNLIELYANSKFESGLIDSERQRKVFLNICKFRADVAAKQTDLDVKDFVFIPQEFSSTWGAFFLSKQFKMWAKKNYFGKLINETNKDYSKFGSAVLKRVGKKLERVPLRTLRNDQGAKSLKEARYVIQEHAEMTLARMDEYEEWDTSNLEMAFDEETVVYERYGPVPKKWFYEQKKLNTQGISDKESIECMAILTLASMKKEDPAGNILFLEVCAAEDRPYEEVHWNRIDGRWLGLGEIETQFENQIYRNMIENLRKRSLLWASKKVYQSKDPDSLLAKNLVRDVKDGDILKISLNGEITQVNQATQALGDYAAAEQNIEQNADQQSFTYEVATGEALPSGTPFRLGVVLSNAVNSHFELKRENLGLFFESVVYELLLPVFKKEYKDQHTITLATTEEGVEELRQEAINLTISQKVKEALLEGRFPDIITMRLDIENDFKSRKNLFVDIKDNFYDDLKVTTQLVITGEQVNLPKRIETLTTLYQALVQVGDPRSEKVLSRILTLSGENFDMLVGEKPPQPQQAMQQMQVQTPANIAV